MCWDLKGTELKAIYSKVLVLSLTFTKETEAHLHLQTTSSFLKKNILVLLISYLLHICHHCFTWSTFCAIKKCKHGSAHNVAEWLNIDVAILW